MIFTLPSFITPQSDPYMYNIMQAHWAYNQAHPVPVYLQAQPYQQPVVWDGGVSNDCYAQAANALGTYGAAVATCATAESGVGAFGCVAMGFSVFGATASAVSACNASANNGNGSAGPGPY